MRRDECWSCINTFTFLASSITLIWTSLHTRPSVGPNARDIMTGNYPTNRIAQILILLWGSALAKHTSMSDYDVFVSRSILATGKETVCGSISLATYSDLSAKKLKRWASKLSNFLSPVYPIGSGALVYRTHIRWSETQPRWSLYLISVPPQHDFFSSCICAAPLHTMMLSLEF